MLNRITCLAGLLALAGCSSALPEPKHSAKALPPPTHARAITVHYLARTPRVPPGVHRLDVWLPVPRSDAQQEIRDLSVTTDLPHELETDSAYGNSVLHAWSERPEATSIELAFSCTRFEERALLEERSANVSREPNPGSRDLKADRLGVIDDSIRRTARQVTEGHADTLGKARAIYDYVIGHMSYDKVAPGWGTGDTLRACHVGKGNCTDFHALFISLARAAGIPARFGIGFALPADKQSGNLEGYHCWAEFWLTGTGWVPVDCSEAWKHADRREFYFGNLDPDRFRLSVGRDLRIPGMRGEPLNYFLNPYAEADGNPAPPPARAISFSTDRAPAG